MPGADQSAEARVGLRLGRGRLRGDAALRRGLCAADGSWGVTPRPDLDRALARLKRGSCALRVC